MKNQTLILIAVACAAVCGTAVSMDDQNLYGQAVNFLSNRNNGILPEAGETTGSYQRRVNEANDGQKLTEDLESSRASLDRLIVEEKKLKLQLQTGMLISEDKTSPSSLTGDQKVAMLIDLTELQGKIVRKRSAVRELAEAVAKDDARIETDELRQEIRDAKFQQMLELRRELWDGCTRREHR